MLNRWETKANHLWTAWVNTLKSAPPNYNAVRMVLAQAQHEDHCGDDWDGYGGWGCCNLRALNAAEIAAFKDGSLKVGWWLYPDGTWGAVHRPDSIGTVRGDTDPNAGAFHVWFAAFPQGPGGPSYMLRAGIRGSVSVLSDPNCTAATYAESLYVNQCYFGGFHPTSQEKAQGWPQPRWCGKRTPPLNKSEQANVDQYAKTCSDNFAGIDAGLKDWVPQGAYAQVPETTIAGDNTSPNDGDETAPAGLPLPEGETE